MIYSKDLEDDLLPEYDLDFEKSKPNRFASMLQKNGINIIRLTSVLFYLISLTQHIYCTQDDCDTIGFFALIFGWMFIGEGGVYLSWLANPFLFFSWIASWIFLKKDNFLVVVLSGISLVLSLSFLCFDKIMVNEAGHYGMITSYSIGYLFWTLSSIVFFFGNLWLKYKIFKHKVQKVFIY